MLQWTITLLCVSAAVAQEWELVWSDEFDGPEIDLDKWEHEITAGGGGNDEFQVYTPDSANSYIQNGMLFIKPTMLADNTNPLTGEAFGEEFLTSGVLDLVELYGDCNVPDWNGCYREGGDIPPIASGRLRTNGKFSYRYGRAEVYAKMPVGDWLWPALWLLPDKWYYGGWPQSGEIDIYEGIGNRDYVCDGEERGIQHMGATLHWGVDFNNNRFNLTTSSKVNETQNYGDYFHLYAFDWTPQGMEFYVDGELIVSFPDPLIDERDPSNCFTGFYDFGAPWIGDAQPWTANITCDDFMAPFDQDFHFLFNIAIGGTNGFIPDDCVNSGGEEGREKPWENGVSQQDGMWAFYNARDSWEDTWLNEGDNLAMQVDWVRVYQPAGGFPRTEVPEGCPVPQEPYNCPDP